MLEEEGVPVPEIVEGRDFQSMDTDLSVNVILRTPVSKDWVRWKESFG